jgi:serpin B
MKAKLLFMSVMATLCMWSCSNKGDLSIDVPYEPQPEEPVTRHSYTPVQLNETQQAINIKLQEFSWKLFKEVYTNREPGTNLMISPISLEVDLGMFINGLEGETLKEVLKTMGLENYTKEQINDFFQTMMKGIEKADEAAIFKSANAFWYNQNKKANSDFLSIIKEKYDAKAEAMDFGDTRTVNIINNWCAEQTNGRISKMLDSITPADIFHLMNAVYFKSRWSAVFSKDATKVQPFYYANGHTADIALMHAYYGTFYVDTDEYQLATKSFVDGAFQFIMILPKEGVDAAKAIPETYNFEKYVNMGMKSVNLELFLPKFTSDYTENNLFNYLANINPTLKFQLDDLKFIDNLKDDDTELKAMQKTFFLVDEEGAEAAAVTDITLVTAAGPSIQIENAYMRLDRPFFYAIVESNTQCPLFIGYYGN